MLAARFSLSPATILSANNLSDPDMLQVGQELTILPTDGVLYTLHEGETLRKVADRYGVELVDIIKANDLGPNPDVVQPGTQPGREQVFRGKGVHRLRGRGRGDLRVLVNVEVPTRLTEAEAELLRKLAESRGEQVGVPEPGLFSRIKSAFQ